MTEEQNSFLAEKLIKRLESVGMRTSYRELYDIFLSKTTNARPIGMVFRRKRSREDRGPNAVAIAAANSRITDEFEWSTDFLQGLSIKCREYEFDRKVPLASSGGGGGGGDEPADGSMLPAFLPRPNVDTAPSHGLVADYLSGLLGSMGLANNCANALPLAQCFESTFGGGGGGSTAAPSSEGSTSTARTQADGTDDFLSNRTLCSLVEQSMGLIFLRRVRAQTANAATGRLSEGRRAAIGTGFAVVRRAEGSWSAPCFLSVLGSKDKFTDAAADELASSFASTQPDDDVKMIVIRKKELVNQMILGNAVKFSVRKDERANPLVRDAAVIGVEEGRFQLATEFFLAVKVNEAQNQGAYSLSTDKLDASDILTGELVSRRMHHFYGFLTKESDLSSRPRCIRNNIATRTIRRLLRSPAEPRATLLDALAPCDTGCASAILRKRLGGVPSRSRIYSRIELRYAHQAPNDNRAKLVVGQAGVRHLRAQVQILSNGRSAGAQGAVVEQLGLDGGEGAEAYDPGPRFVIQLVPGAPAEAQAGREQRRHTEQLLHDVREHHQAIADTAGGAVEPGRGGEEEVLLDRDRLEPWACNDVGEVEEGCDNTALWVEATLGNGKVEGTLVLRCLPFCTCCNDMEGMVYSAPTQGSSSEHVTACTIMIHTSVFEAVLKPSELSG